jgi:hypothetical protein
MVKTRRRAKMQRRTRSRRVQRGGGDDDDIRENLEDKKNTSDVNQKYIIAINAATDDLKQLIRDSNLFDIPTHYPMNISTALDVYNYFYKLNTDLKEACKAQIATKKWSNYFTRSPAQQVNDARKLIKEHLSVAINLIHNRTDVLYEYAIKRPEFKYYLAATKR